jgi:hypothetical protein
VAAHGARARAGLAHLTAEQQEVDYLLNVGDGVLVLRKPHRPADYRAPRRDEDLRRLVHLFARDAALLDQLFPTRLAQRARELLEAVRVLVYELPVEHVAGPQLLRPQDLLHDSFEQRHVAVDAHLQEEV